MDVNKEQTSTTEASAPISDQSRKKTSKSEFVYNFIQNGIIDGVWKAGDRINDKTIAEHLNVNRLSVREALSRFIQNKIVEHTPWKGYFIRLFTPEEVVHFVEVRVALEQLAIKNIVKKSRSENKKYFTAMKEIIEQSKETLENCSHAEYMKTDFTFHELLYAASGNHWISDTIVNARILINILRNLSMGDDDEQFRYAAIQSIKDHRDILTALENADEELAHRLMEEHLSDRFTGNIIKRL